MVISSGSQIIGPKTIGDNVIIGAGSVVVHDISDSSVVTGVPAKVISNDGERHTQYYLKNY
ncbi:hypothetical protein ACFQHQ_11885 [Zunongwangia atlantica 22II14-10F7]|uniref:Serine O-acetyltransferase (Serine acetyltransferase) n=1 Tax=Zunongwangia atlantica 22II14-10F7 TaxID=1185767 RepID=A0A1Y1SY98_9FLAO|nr:serine O-acetyltransferase (serine acetyltransferase) [Zunongwangia atlantica 22II14-10F7]